MRATLMIGTLVLMAACAEQPIYQEPAPKVAGTAAHTTTPSPCKRSDYPDGAAGDTAYTNCIIEN